VWKKLLAVVTMLVVLIGLPFTGAKVGAWVGEATCDRDGEFLDCLGETVEGALAGLLAGLVASLLLLTLVVLRYRRQRRVMREALGVEERELETGGLN
jgi:ABC-type Fe3+ transport system permease subunit